ncbi:pvuII DNA methyltransferase [Rhizobium leguminosarum bv. phaseoli CCGM1]|nr:pvuII DNA methyltransferase [Rhizobium leguminosarum bv. phaseoli CCGM1]
MLTDPGDIVVDIFAGSNTTGQAAEALGRRWRAFELSREYVAASVFRFLPSGLSDEEIAAVYHSVMNGAPVHVEAAPDLFSLAAE